jgi:hypothetical protein
MWFAHFTPASARVFGAVTARWVKGKKTAGFLGETNNQRCNEDDVLTFSVVS